MDAIDYLDPLVGVVQACAALGVNRARVYRVRARRCHLAGTFIGRGPRARPPLALTGVEQEALLDVLNSDRFADMAPASIHATLLDEGRSWARYAPCTGYWPPAMRCVSDATSSPTRSTPSQSCWPPVRANSAYWPVLRRRADD